MTDPLDQPSGVGVEEWNPAEPWMLHVRELTLRELKAQCARRMQEWDSYSPWDRHQMQRLNDPYYSKTILRMTRGSTRAST